MSTKKPKPPRYHLRYMFVSTKNGSASEHVTLSLVEAEKARLRDMARRLEHPAATAQMRESGEVMLTDIAQLLAQARTMQIGSAVGERLRRAAGDRKAAQILKHADPLKIASERHVRRVKKSHRPEK